MYVPNLVDCNPLQTQTHLKLIEVLNRRLKYCYCLFTITHHLRLAENLFSFLALPDFFRQLSQTKLEE